MRATQTLSRRRVLGSIGAVGIAAASGSFVPMRITLGQQAKVKLGLMLPYTGTYAALGKNIDEALRLAIAEKGGKLGGRDVEYLILDDESEPAKGSHNPNMLITRDTLAFLLRTVHSA